ncbi:MAG: hypothetical protein A2W91_17735 [Bacteroidetes bacterium GWF2_38_335]|nr:MAG: hypothetical protein A2W91_17735 [Bacteroidetes bacterium GWF2_38_335]OFY78024.1 MAG: hypothetical protein A2281_18725 [Bacteroidetes bacterium RIFOXYA12_FULL_38_20]HBS88296.1 hypothetical protein [Bacteroidales bacterium]
MLTRVILFSLIIFSLLSCKEKLSAENMAKDICNCLVENHISGNDITVFNQKSPFMTNCGNQILADLKMKLSSLNNEDKKKYIKDLIVELTKTDCFSPAIDFFLSNLNL